MASSVSGTTRGSRFFDLGTRSREVSIITSALWMEATSVRRIPVDHSTPRIAASLRPTNDDRQVCSNALYSASDTTGMARGSGRSTFGDSKRSSGLPEPMNRRSGAI
jgi:hypothetical protein